MPPAIEDNNLAQLLDLTTNALIPILPPKIIGIGSIIIAFVILVGSYIRNCLPRKTLPALRRLLDDVDDSVGLLADTRRALESRASLKALKNEASKCEERHLAISLTSWSSYPFALLRVVRAIDVVKRQTRHLLIAVKTRVEVERQAQYRAHNLLDIVIEPLTAHSPRDISNHRELKRTCSTRQSQLTRWTRGE
ncbi:hypothetical protein C8J56DRAFT_1131065 [Mycena floridula]|nr:hypothetical protein C8J56DRAFT_1131065 [Mycena floridula]